MSKSDKNANLSVHFEAGDIIFVKSVSNPRSLKAGNIISFMSTNSDSYGETITHMIREVKKDDAGNVLGYVTYGTNTGVNDEALVEPEYILGVYSGQLPKMGKFFLFLKTTPGYITCVLVPFVLVIGYNVFNCIVIFRRYRKEQLAEVKAERDQIALERQEAEAMRLQLEALQAQLAAQGATIPQQPAPNVEPTEVAPTVSDNATEQL
jgi:signal peptidase I